jgi:hypothetical protein
LVLHCVHSIFGHSVLDFIACASDGADSDCQNLSLVINDIPKVSFSMKNGYYWYPELKVNPASGYEYKFDDNFIPEIVERRIGTVKNPQLRLLYVPCLGEELQPLDEDIVPKDEYIRLNASYEDVFHPDGLFYNWSYSCDDHSGNPDIYRKIEFCNSDVCYVGPDVAHIVCLPSSDIIFRLELSDGISIGNISQTYHFRQCLSCRPCCTSPIIASTPEDLCNFRYKHLPRVDAQYDVQQVGGKLVYGTAEAKFAFKNTISNVGSSFIDMMNWLKYDSSNSDTGIAPSAMTALNRGLFGLHSATNLNTNDVFSNPFELVNSGPRYTYRRLILTTDAMGVSERFVDYSDLQPLRVCVIDSAFGVNYLAEWDSGYTRQDIYYSSLLYYHPSCNGLNSFCDLKNLYFGDEKVSEPIPSLAILSNSMQLDPCRAIGEQNVGTS